MYQGWNNEVTYQWALLAQNDRETMQLIDDYHCSSLTAPAYNVLLRKIPRKALPEHLQELYHQVDLLEIFLDRAYQLYSDGRIDMVKIEQLLRHFNGDFSSYFERYLGKRPITFSDTTGFSTSTADCLTPADHSHGAMAYAITANPTQEETTVKAIEIKTITYVNGTDVKTLTVQQKVALLAELEDEIKALKQVKIKSKMIEAEAFKKTGDLAKLVLLFDQDIDLEEVKKS